jgi:hypothetical protein
LADLFGSVDLGRLFDEAQNFLDVMSGKDAYHRKELDQIHSTLRRHYAESYGHVLNRVDKDKLEPSELAFKQKILEALADLDKRVKGMPKKGAVIDVETDDDDDDDDDEPTYAEKISSQIAQLKALLPAEEEESSGKLEKTGKTVKTAKQRKSAEKVADEFFDKFY